MLSLSLISLQNGNPLKLRTTVLYCLRVINNIYKKGVPKNFHQRHFLHIQYIIFCLTCQQAAAGCGCGLDTVGWLWWLLVVVVVLRGPFTRMFCLYIFIQGGSSERLGGRESIQDLAQDPGHQLSASPGNESPQTLPTNSKL